MKKPVVLVVMDGVGETPEELGNMVKKGHDPDPQRTQGNLPVADHQGARHGSRSALR